MSAVIIRNEMAMQGPVALNDIVPAGGLETSPRAAGLAYKGITPSHCRLKDRFDRGELIAYHFDDEQTRLGLDVDMDGFSLSDVADFDVEAVKLEFRYRFQPIKKRKERCLYASPWQGLLGSGYNEFHVRADDTVYEELEEEMDDVEDKLNKLF